MADEKALTRDEIVKYQAKYKGDDLFELVDVEIIKDSKYYKKGDTDRIHPATSELFRAKGLIK